MNLISDTSKSNFSNIPTDPGVYLFKGEKDEILYIGKAKNLRARVRSYFSNSTQSPKTKQLISKIKRIEWILVNNEVEALLLENKLVKKNLPKYNVNLKDAKTFAYIALTKEEFPRLLTSRKVSSRLESFGPYTDGFTRQDLMRLVVKIFKLRVCKKFPKRACLNFHLNLCTAPCMGKVSVQEYGEQVEQARSFLCGNYEKVIERLGSQMLAASRDQKFEFALELRNQISAIGLLTQKQIVDKERGFDQDVIVFRNCKDKALVVQMSIRKGVLLGKKEYSLDLQQDIRQEFLKAFYAMNKIPREILLNKSCWQDKDEKQALEEFFSLKRGALTSLIVPSRGEKVALVRLAEKNLECASDEDNVLNELKTMLNLPDLPRAIECFDISNLGQEHIVSGMARFVYGKPEKKSYRRFKIRTLLRQDDTAAIKEVVKRRYKRLIEDNARMPDLVVVDGGLGQTNAAKEALRSLGLQLPLIGLAKQHEEIYFPNEPNPIRIEKNNRIMLLLREIRDEAHRFSLGYSHKRRQMKMRDEFKEKRFLA